MDTAEQIFQVIWPLIAENYSEQLARFDTFGLGVIEQEIAPENYDELGMVEWHQAAVDSTSYIAIVRAIIHIALEIKKRHGSRIDKRINKLIEHDAVKDLKLTDKIAEQATSIAEAVSEILP